MRGEIGELKQRRRGHLIVMVKQAQELVRNKVPNQRGKKWRKKMSKDKRKEREKEK